MKLKRQLLIIIMINILLLQNLINQRQKTSLQDSKKQILQAKVILLMS